jgi:type IV pilus assembly protein PilW
VTLDALHAARQVQKGLSLIELMIGIAIGMLIVVSVLSMYLSTSRTYRTTENLSRVQENARIAFELMATEIREAGFTPCGNNLPLASALRQPVNPGIWWNATGLRGYDATQVVEGVAVGTTRASRAANTSAIQIGAGRGTGVTIESHNAPAASFSVNTVHHGLDDNDIVIVCDNELATIFQVTNASPGTNNTIVHNESNCAPGNPGCPVPGNETRCLGTAANCALQAQDWKSYARNGVITAYSTSLWYVGCARDTGCNQPGGRSLFRIPNGAAATPAQEIVTDVDNMQFLYLRRGETNYVPAASIAANQWADVTAVRITLTLTSPDANVSTNAGVNQGRLTRTVTHTVTLRNRVL